MSLMSSVENLWEMIAGHLGWIVPMSRQKSCYEQYLSAVLGDWVGRSWWRLVYGEVRE